MTQGLQRIRREELKKKVISPKDAAAIFKDGMSVGFSGFTPAGYPKSIPLEVIKRVTENGEILRFSLFTGASLGAEIEDAMATAGMIKKRLPYQGSVSCRGGINNGDIDYIDQHISSSPQLLRYGFLGELDIAVAEACAITEDGLIIPTTAVGNMPVFIERAKKVLIEINTTQPVGLEGMHDILIPKNPPRREAIPIYDCMDRIGQRGIPIDSEKIAGIVICDLPDRPYPLAPVNETARRIALNLMDFLSAEIKAGRLPKNLLPLQSGVGNVANAVLACLSESDYSDLVFFSEVIQDAVLDLIDLGKLNKVSATGFALSPDGLKRFYNRLDFYAPKIILRPQEITNNPEVIRRLGLIAMNTAIETDIYGNINSTHLMGTAMMNGIGGSGEFARSSYLSFFLTPSTAKGGAISSIVPMVSHVDHTEHDTMIIVTEHGAADLRFKSPRERAMEIINNCVDPDFKPFLTDYFRRASQKGNCHTPHILSEALSWHERYNNTGSMKP